MGEPNQYVFSFKELAEALIKKQDLHEGIWGVYVEFAIHGANAGPSDDQLLPTAIVPIMKLGLQKFGSENNLSVDAAKVNPVQASKK